MKKGKLLLKGKIILLSPALIGSGKDERSDMDLIRDREGKPFIPATSFVGVLRHTINIDSEPEREKLKRFWGSDENDEKYFQSALYCKDLTLIGENPMISLRDGVAIDNCTGRAKDKEKFNYEVLEPGTAFELEIEIDLLKGHEDFFKKILATIIELLKSGDLCVGAKTRNGLGRIKLEEYKVYEFDFTKKADLLRWLKRDFSTPVEFNIAPFSFNTTVFKLTADFKIKNSLIIRSYTGDPSKPDAVHISSSQGAIIPGASLKGAIRARAERIVNTLGIDSSVIKNLFGYVDEKTKEARRGRLKVEETVLCGYPAEVQTRIKIDRFTGGVMEGALLESSPLFSTRDEKVFQINITIEDCKDYEAGLLLLVLKDLWTGDLPLGGEKAIGRGVLIGKKAEISYNGKKFTIPENIKDLPQETREELQSFVNSLLQKKIRR